jgi:hypothetical protein
MVRLCQLVVYPQIIGYLFNGSLRINGAADRDEGCGYPALGVVRTDNHVHSMDSSYSTNNFGKFGRGFAFLGHGKKPSGGYQGQHWTCGSFKNPKSHLYFMFV